MPYRVLHIAASVVNRNTKKEIYTLPDFFLLFRKEKILFLNRVWVQWGEDSQINYLLRSEIVNLTYPNAVNSELWLTEDQAKTLSTAVKSIDYYVDSVVAEAKIFESEVHAKEWIASCKSPIPHITIEDSSPNF